MTAQSQQQPKPPKRHLSIGFTVALLAKSVPQAAKTLVHGPQRSNRTRRVDAFVRFFRAASQQRGMSVWRARTMLNRLNLLGRGAMVPLLKGCRFEAATWSAALVGSSSHDAVQEGDSVSFSSSLTSTYKLELNAPWNVQAEWIHPEAGQSDKVILFFHGGAYVFGDLAMYRPFLAPLAKQLGTSIFNVDYRLSPEATFPSALHDAVSAFLYLTTVKGIHPRKIVFAGDSAGGNLAIVTLLFLANHGMQLPGGCVLLSPWSDLCHDLPSYAANAAFDYIPGSFDSLAMNPVRMYIGADEYLEPARTEQYISPIAYRGNGGQDDATTAVAPLPPIYICTGSDESLLDENILLAATLASFGGGKVIHHVFHEQIHVFPFLAPESADTACFRDQLLTFVDGVGAEDAPASLKAGAVEAVVFTNGVETGRGVDSAWGEQWAGIMQTKGLPWTLEQYKAPSAAVAAAPVAVDP
ncbi:Alpha/Beta hydrolase protein [Blastocladiella britannica]|nr:Alpha/Beta hydrolase protein [Blastocladiella britannica]